MHPDLRCYYHPNRQATSQCDSCGDMLCPICQMEFEGQHLCSTCLHDARRGSLGSDGSLCALSLLAIVIAGPVLGVLSIPVLVIGIIEAGTLSGAVFLCVRGRGCTGASGNNLRKSLLLMSVAPLYLWLVCGLVFFTVLQADVSDFGAGAMEQIVSPRLIGAAMFPLMALCALLGWLMPVLLAIRKLHQATRDGVRPLWAVIVTLIIAIFELLLLLSAGLLLVPPL